MKLGWVLAAVAGLMVSGCGMMDCGANTTNGYGAGSCGLHTPFFRAHAQNDSAPVFTKS
jgi:hypothetical protein